MKWVDIRDKILDVVGQCVRIDTCWRDQAQNVVRRGLGNDGDDVICKLHAFATNTVGRDDFRREYNSGTNKLDVTQAGLRRFTVQCLVESFDQGERFCLEYTERVRTCMMRPAVLAMLREVNLTCTGVAQSVDVSYVFDARQVSAASVDIYFACANNETSSDGPGLESEDWIETVEGHRTDPDVPAPIDAELIHEQ